MDRNTLFRMLAEKASDSAWREIGKEALKTAVNTLIEEGIEATVEIWKKRRLKIQEEYLENRGSEDGSAVSEAGRERKDYPSGEEDRDEAPADEPPSEAPDDEERAAGDSFGGVGRRSGIEDFRAYVFRNGSNQ